MKTVITVAIVALLAGCGQTGELFLPSTGAPAPVATPDGDNTSNSEEQEAADEQETPAG